MKITEPKDLLKQGKDWWNVRAIILARDRNKEIGPKKLELRIWLRRN